MGAYIFNVYMRDGRYNFLQNCDMMQYDYVQILNSLLELI